MCNSVQDGARVPSTAIRSAVRVNKMSLILIVDDDKAMCEATTGLVHAFGFAVQPYGSGEALLASDRLDETACLILDVHMPGMSGLELDRRLKASGWSIPTVFITAFPDRAVRGRAMRTGAVGYLSKPFSAKVLLKTIRRALEKGSENGVA